jgi:LysM repeat protein
MKTTTILTIVAAGLTTLSITSCGTSDPEYKAWKAQQKAKTDNNPYGVPQAGGETGTYTPSGGAAPYQPLPGVNPAPTPQPPLAASSPVPAMPSSSPSAGSSSHTVVAGDSLWKLARKYNTSVEAIQAANGMTDTNIQVGKTITIPGQ